MAEKGSGIDGNTHIPHDCPYCWRVLYSKGALTNHVNNEHWKELEAETRDEEDNDIIEPQIGEPVK